MLFKKMLDSKKAFKRLGLKVFRSKSKEKLETDKKIPKRGNSMIDECSEKSPLKSSLGYFLQQLKRGCLTNYQKKNCPNHRGSCNFSSIGATGSLRDSNMYPVNDCKKHSRSSGVQGTKYVDKRKSSLCSSQTDDDQTRKSNQGQAKEGEKKIRLSPNQQYKSVLGNGDDCRSISYTDSCHVGEPSRKSKRRGGIRKKTTRLKHCLIKKLRCSTSHREYSSMKQVILEKINKNNGTALMHKGADPEATAVQNPKEEHHKKCRKKYMKMVRKFSPILVLSFQRGFKRAFQAEKSNNSSACDQKVVSNRTRLCPPLSIRRIWYPVNMFENFLDFCIKKRSTIRTSDFSSLGFLNLIAMKDRILPTPLQQKSGSKMYHVRQISPKEKSTALEMPTEETKAECIISQSSLKKLTSTEECMKGVFGNRQRATDIFREPLTPTSLPKIGLSDFRIIKLIGKGGFGEVYLAEYIRSGKLMALKVLDKRLAVAKKKQHLFNEHAVLVKSCQMPFLLSLYYSFESEHYVYFAMKYCPGGDLRTLLNVVGALDEQDARLYMAEIIYSVDALHKLGYIHRDLKPDNFLIDENGHLVLADFGLSKENSQSYYDIDSIPHFRREEISAESNRTCSILLGEQQLDTLNMDNLYSRFKRTRTAAAETVIDTVTASSASEDKIKQTSQNTETERHQTKVKTSPSHISVMTATCSSVGKYHRELAPRKPLVPSSPLTPQKRRVMAYSMVGSPDYMSPEVLSKNGYGYEIDWWSTGCLFFELTMGVPPFFADTVEGVFYNISHWETKLPEILRQCDQSLSPESLDLITILLCKFESRAELRGIENFKCHPYFKDISWDNLYSHTPPFVPILSDIEDTSYFQPMTTKEQKMIPVDLLSRRN